MDITLQEAFAFLLSARQRNFYVRVVSALKAHIVPGFTTVAVGITPEGTYGFFYDPEFIKRMPLQELVLACEHEVMHLLYEHIPRFLNLITNVHGKEDREFQRRIMNVAADVAVNELMKKEPSFDERWGKYFYGSDETAGRSFLFAAPFGFLEGQPFEAYRRRLLDSLHTFTQENELHGQAGKGVPWDFQLCRNTADIMYFAGFPMPMAAYKQVAYLYPKDRPNDPFFPIEREGSGHAYWIGVPDDSEGDGQGPGGGGTPLTDEELQALSESLRSEGKNLVRQAVEDHQKARGTLPATIKELVEAYLTPPVIPWPQVLRSLVTRTRQQKISRGMTRPSRRLHGVPGILPFPGKSRDSKFTIVFALDTSGSMDTSDLKLGLEEILHIVQTEPDVHLVVLYCDADVHADYDVRSMSDVKFEVGGRGGTDFNPVFQRVREFFHNTERAPDVLVYATDGYAPAPEPENRVPIPVIWLLTPHGVEPSPDYGIHLRMKDQ